MTMTTDGARRDRHTTRGLADMLSVDAESETYWDETDLRTILQHQLRTPLPHDVTTDQPSHPPPVHADRVGVTFGDLLHSDNSPPALRRRAKDYAKQCATEPEGPLPKTVATALYYALIAAGLTDRDPAVTTLPAAALIEGFEWVQRQNWVDARTKRVIAAARKHSLFRT